VSGIAEPPKNGPHNWTVWLSADHHKMGRPRPDYDLATVEKLAKELGIGPVAPSILKLAHHTTIRLFPLSIVARVQSAEPVERAAAAMERELALGRHLAAVGAPAVRPTIDPSPGPHIRGRAVTTLWSFVEHRPARDESDLTEAAEALRFIHKAMLGFRGDLPPFTRVFDRCGKLLGDPGSMPDIAPQDRAFLRDRLRSLREGLGSFTFDSVPLHGDTHAGNILVASHGAVWADLEAVCLGPLEWDLTPLHPAARSRFGRFDSALLDHFSELGRRVTKRRNARRGGISPWSIAPSRSEPRCALVRLARAPFASVRLGSGAVVGR
jgi:Phosphotransferase enzyme family